jgi:hypothetical protein
MEKILRVAYLIVFHLTFSLLVSLLVTIAVPLAYSKKKRREEMRTVKVKNVS